MKLIIIQTLFSLLLITSCSKIDTNQQLHEDLSNMNLKLEQELNNELIKSGGNFKDSAIVRRTKNKLYRELELLDDEKFQEVKTLLSSSYGLNIEDYTNEQLKTMLLIKQRDYLFKSIDSIGSNHIEFDNLDVYLINILIILKLQVNIN